MFSSDFYRIYESIEKELTDLEKTVLFEYIVVVDRFWSAHGAV